MEDLLPLLVFIIISIFSVLGRDKNKNKKPPKKNKGKSILEELMDQINEGKKPKVETPTSIIIEDTPKEEPQNIRDYITERNDRPALTSSREGISALKDRRKNKDLIKNKEIKDKSEKTGRTLDDFNLKKAVIYSEILNRKYV